MKVIKISVELYIPEYSVKYCDNCKYHLFDDYNSEYICRISGKIIKQKENKIGGSIVRPYGCRCLAKHFEEKGKEEEIEKE